MLSSKLFSRSLLALAAGVFLAASAYADEAQIRKNIAERFPDWPKIDELSKTPVPGLYELRLGSQIFYVDETGNWSASRTDFGDATDFVGWYTARTARLNRLSRADAYSLYLAYHEGDTGYRRGSYKRKPWLLATARRVATLADRYRMQLARCETRIAEQSRSWFSWAR